MKAVRGSGGTAIIQDPATAEVGQLPQMALANGAASKVLPPEAIIEEVAQVLKGAYAKRSPTQ